MESTVYNPQKGRLETHEVELSADNTTWFNNRGAVHTGTLAAITDCHGGLLITTSDYSYPLWLGGMSRSDVNFSQTQARKLRQQYQ